jgi:hypothetical protein
MQQQLPAGRSADRALFCACDTGRETRCRHGRILNDPARSVPFSFASGAQGRLACEHDFATAPERAVMTGPRYPSALGDVGWRRGLCACLALLLALPPGDALRADDDTREAQRLLQSGQILPLEAILQRAKAVRPGKLLDVELERDDGRYVYELELLDNRGSVWKLKYDAATGKLLEHEPD